VERPEQYRRNSLGYHIQTNNKVLEKERSKEFELSKSDRFR